MFLIVACRYLFPPEVLRRISSRITNEVEGINRVTYDISSKPPAVSLSLPVFFIQMVTDFLPPADRRMALIVLIHFCIIIPYNNHSKSYRYFHQNSSEIWLLSESMVIHSPPLKAATEMV